jgi:hypothetical protein
VLTLSRQTPIVVETPADEQQYAVVLCSEEQLDRLLQRQRAAVADPRRINAADMYERYTRLKRRVIAAAAICAIGGVGMVNWKDTTRPLLASVLPFMAAPVMPALATGASFSVSAATPRTSDSANDVVSRMKRMGLPAFVRLMPDGHTYQVLVGPYAYLDEAEGAQRRLDAMGFGRGRLFVDDSLRPANESASATSRDDMPGMLLIGAADHVSLVFEIAEEIGKPATNRLGESQIGIDLGPVPTMKERRLAAPAGVSLLRDVAVEEIISEDGTRHAYARVSFPASARANVRAEGQRVYVDMAWPQDFEESRPRPAAPAKAPAAAAAAAPARSAIVDDGYKDAMRPLRLRFEEVSPFVVAASRTPSPEVLAALEQTLASLEGSLGAVTVPAASAAEHHRVVSAVRIARQAMRSGFTGDRLAQATQAVEVYEGAQNPPPQ